LEEGILLLRLKPVGSKETETTSGLFSIQAIIITLEELEDIVDNDSLKVDFFLIIQIICL
jgi:hypothetical protein